MGFLDRLLGRTKDVAGSAMDKVQDVVPDSVENAVGGAVDKAGDAVDKTREVAGDVADKVTGADEPSPPPAS